MVLIDTSVWISHFRFGNSRLKKLLIKGQVICHPFILGELTCGNLQNRSEILSLLQALPQVVEAEHGEILHFIEMHSLMGMGLGYTDIHILASARLSGVSLWTLDKPLQKAAQKLGISFT